MKAFFEESSLAMVRAADRVVELWLWVLTLHAVVALIPGTVAWPDKDE